MIELRGVCKSFQRPGEGPIEVLKDFDLDVGTGELVAVVGPSGSGKTTLMNILGLLDRPDRGTYSLDGEPVCELSSDELARRRNRKIGFVFQQFHLLPRTTARENVELPLIYSGAADPEERAVEALRQVGLEDRATHYPNELSGGQQQRVAVARAVVGSPKLILADEPTGNLDSQNGEEVMGMLNTLNEQGTTVLMVTHSPSHAARAHRIVNLLDGRVVAADQVAI